MQKTFLKGKDRDLESTIAAMLEKLVSLDIDVKEASVLNPVPYVHSMHVHDSACIQMFTNGKGACDKSSKASALGEYFERLSCNYFFADYYLGQDISSSDFVHYPNERWFEVEADVLPNGLLDEGLWTYYNPEGELHAEQLFDLNSGAGERGICALPFHRVSDNQAIYFPVNIIGNLYVSNGMAAGNTMYEARVQALSEICERYVKNKIIAEGLCLPEIPQAVIERFPHIQISIEALKAKGYHLRLADASLGGVYPVISVTLINPQDASVFASFGAHPCFEVALERTVTELLQGRELSGFNDLGEFQAPSFNLDEVADAENLVTHFINATGLIAYDFFKEEADYNFVDWNIDLDTQSQFEYLTGIIHKMGLEIYIADYEHLGVYACRIIVPGMSEIYPVDDLVWNNNNEGALFREVILSLNHAGKESWQNLLNELEENEYPDMLKIAEFIGVLPDVHTPWASLQLGELKAMLYLALGELEKANEWHNWCLHIGRIDEARKLHYKCLHAVIEIELDESRALSSYLPSLLLMYGEVLVQSCKNLMEGKDYFHGLHSPGLSLDGFKTHLKLLEGYGKVQKAKERFS